MKKAILMVCFGTTESETRQKTMDCMAQKIQERFPEYSFYCAWTSETVRRMVMQREQLVIPDVKTALQLMRADGVSELAVLPWFVVRGLEYEQMLRDIRESEAGFDTVIIGEPILGDETDLMDTVGVLADHYIPEPDQAVVFAGHGTENESNTVYWKMEQYFYERKRKDILMGTLKEKDALERIIHILRERKIKSVLLVPFMISAGRHVMDDLAGDGTQSWKSRLQEQGFQVKCVLKGLGEYRQIQELFMKHAETVMDQMNEVF